MSSSTVNVGQQLQALLASVSTAIGQGAQYGWDVTVRQQIISGIGYATVAGILFIGVMTFLVIGISSVRKHNAASKEADKEGYATGAFVSFLLVAILLTFSLGAGYAAIARFENPGFYAMQYFINAAQQNNQ